MKTQEQVWTQQSVPADLWRTSVSREAFWTEMRLQAVKYAAADGKTLTDAPGTREILYERYASGPDGEAKFVECTEAEAGFVRLRLSCWASKE